MTAFSWICDGKGVRGTAAGSLPIWGSCYVSTILGKGGNA